jgi:PAS domain S-box-containing protein
MGLHIDKHARLVFEEATDGVFFSTPDGVYVSVNQSGHRLLGYGDGELIGKSISDVVIERDLPRLKAELAAIAGGNVSTQIWPLVKKDGEIVDFEVRAQLLSNGDVLAIVRDLGLRAEFERKIQASEAKLWSILRTAPDTVMSVDRAGCILFINRTYPPYTVEQVVGASCYDFVPPESRARVARAIEHVFTSRAFDEYEVEGPPDVAGNRAWVSVRVGPLVQGEKVVAATLCATDVSGYKREVARTRELLERLRKIARLVPGVLFQYQLYADGSACFPYASDRIREALNVTPEEVAADAASVFALIHPDDRERITTSLHATAVTQSPWHSEFRVQLPNHDVRWLSGDAVPERADDGSTLWHGLLTDVTERRRAEQAQAALEERLLQAQKMESIGLLAGGVAHDFNNLLTAMVGFVELAQEELPGATPQVREYLDGIREATRRGAALTQQLLSFARKRIVNPENVDLDAVVTRLAPMIRRIVGEHISVELALASPSSLVKVDVGGIEQVLMNLIVNARDAMRSGGTLTVDTQELVIDGSTKGEHLDLAPGSYVVLGVTDTGSGMTPAVRARLFEPFFTTKPPGEGTGLGLAMCHGIVKQARGTISVRSEEGQGTTFRIYLPHQAGALRSAAVVDASVIAHTGKETLLVVEDAPMILRVVRDFLQKLGYRVISASDGAEALEVAAKADTPVDLLVTDVVMPKIGGKELAARLKETHPRVKVLYMSGYAENAIAHQGVLPQGLNFIEKPYSLSDLARRVREVLNRD